ncbi:MAG: class IV adenylate cyclase [Pirellulales bacterium]|nr:class IV adenylate cyclase [Pirellulales bacterium]
MDDSEFVSMPENVEIKARAHDFDRQQSLAALLCGQAGEKILQRDTFYDVPQGRLKLREFGDGSGELIYYLRPDDRQAKLSDYVLSKVAVPDALNAVLSKALTLAGEVCKERCLYLHGQTRIHFDRVEGLGEFIELEVVMRSGQPINEGQQIVADLMERLEIAEEDLIAEAYIDLPTDLSEK